MPETSDLFGAAPPAMLVFGGVVVAIVITVFATVIVKGVSQAMRNNASPVITTTARVVTKRSDVRGGAGESHARTAYFATFETPDSERHELALPAREFGLIADGDSGQLTYQGTRFKGFARSSLRSH